MAEVPSDDENAPDLGRPEVDQKNMEVKPADPLPITPGTDVVVGLGLRRAACRLLFGISLVSVSRVAGTLPPRMPPRYGCAAAALPLPSCRRRSRQRCRHRRRQRSC